ncbi:hypothetical protein C8R45DRAFT_941268 [Mycena sanguinolenta]|nr:hypothetical protein C8R45DRAFT_941268 [Mycena sanguinolenta]
MDPDWYDSVTIDSMRRLTATISTFKKLTHHIRWGRAGELAEENFEEAVEEEDKQEEGEDSGEEEFEEPILTLPQRTVKPTYVDEDLMGITYTSCSSWSTMINFDEFYVRKLIVGDDDGWA